MSLERPMVCDSSTVTTPSLPTLSMTSAISLPISVSRAEIVATCSISFLPLNFLDICFKAPSVAS